MPLDPPPPKRNRRAVNGSSSSKAKVFNCRLRQESLNPDACDDDDDPALPQCLFCNMDLSKNENNATTLSLKRNDINKPEGHNTIGMKRNDLQSALPFMLHSPLSSQNSLIQRERAVIPKSTIIVARVAREMK
mmetsp:Transcript_39683/g.67645  ORF Transcript_39683/g.67645 Transcript_39683/m.67645 type:complete len:133 (-) Transcript_39683:48-446(-)